MLIIDQNHLEKLFGTLFVYSWSQPIKAIFKENTSMRKDTGFSLLELMVVIGIIAILSTIAIPGIIQWLPKHRVGNAARDVKSTLEFARSNAIKTNSAVIVAFDNDSLTVTSGGTTLRTRQLSADVVLVENEVLLKWVLHLVQVMMKRSFATDSLKN